MARRVALTPAVVAAVIAKRMFPALTGSASPVPASPSVTASSVVTMAAAVSAASATRNQSVISTPANV